MSYYLAKHMVYQESYKKKPYDHLTIRIKFKMQQNRKIVRENLKEFKQRQREKFKNRERN
jgi:hypothetical protein